MTTVYFTLDRFMFSAFVLLLSTLTICGWLAKQLGPTPSEDGMESVWWYHVISCTLSDPCVHPASLV